MKAAERSDWKTEPMPSRRTEMVLDRWFSSEEASLLRAGVIPEQMEDKWFIYWLDDKLYFHRSWTGFCVYIATFVRDGERYRMISALVNRDAGQYRETSEEKDRRMISFLIDVVLLRRRVPFPDANGTAGADALSEWSQVGRAGHGDHPSG